MNIDRPFRVGRGKIRGYSNVLADNFEIGDSFLAAFLESLYGPAGRDSTCQTNYETNPEISVSALFGLRLNADSSIYAAYKTLSARFPFEMFSLRRTDNSQSLACR
jgi:hypothetical protein